MSAGSAVGAGDRQSGRPRVLFEARDERRIALQGELSFATATAALQESRRLFNGRPAIELDLAGVGRADSAGLALLLEWIHWARNHDCRLSLHNIPQQIIAIAQISEAEGMLRRGHGGD